MSAAFCFLLSAFCLPLSAYCLLPSDHLALRTQISTDIDSERLEELNQDQVALEISRRVSVTASRPGGTSTRCILSVWVGGVKPPLQPFSTGYSLPGDADFEAMERRQEGCREQRAFSALFFL
jgi:hypothetical protein